MIRVLAAVIQRDDKYLLCLRPQHKRHGGLWEFPGGKLEPGESNLDAVRRELSEELALEVIAIGNVLFSIVDPGSEFIIDFVPVTARGEPQCREHSALQWTSLHDMRLLHLAPSDARVAEYLRENVLAKFER